MWQDKGRQCEMKTSLHVEFLFAGRRSLLSCVSAHISDQYQHAQTRTQAACLSGYELHRDEWKRDAPGRAQGP